MALEGVLSRILGEKSDFSGKSSSQRDISRDGEVQSGHSGHQNICYKQDYISSYIKLHRDSYDGI